MNECSYDTYSGQRPGRASLPPLWIAARTGSARLVQLFLSYGALTVEPEDGVSKKVSMFENIAGLMPCFVEVPKNPLLCEKVEELVRLLLRAGAEPTKKDVRDMWHYGVHAAAMEMERALAGLPPTARL